VQTKPIEQEFGVVREQKRLHFPSGLLGFEDVKDYVILDDDEGIPLRWLQAVDEPDLAFVIMDPFLVMPTYDVKIDEATLCELNVDDPSNLVLLVLVTIPHDRPTDLTANMQGPLVVNRETQWAKQLVLSNSAYHTRHPIFTV
jgi:flagellar assembly factor FliW